MARYAELVLPCSSLMAIILYFHPDLFPTWRLGNDPVNNAVTLMMWGLIGGLGGVLVTSGAILVFCLLYSPIYLVTLVPHLIGPPKWVDKSEVRFYTRCFVLLCVVGAITYLNASAGAVALIILAGSPFFLRRFLL